MTSRTAGMWFVLLVFLSARTICAQPPLAPVIEAEETVYRFESANNGAGPMWCSGSTCLVRIQDKLFASGLETIPDLAPLNNCRWMLFQRLEAGWQLRNRDPSGRTREPCPIAGFATGHLFLSANPTLTHPPQTAGPAQPQILRWDAAAAAETPETILPAWSGTPAFSEHSYRSFAADGDKGELILFQNVGSTHAEWAFRDGDTRWSAQGMLQWPWGAEYDQPQPVRICYPNVMLRNRAVHVCGVSDIVEPYAQWRAYKKELTGREWDYDFRRLFYTWCDDITSGEFAPWVEIASRDKTCGWIWPCDLYLAADGRVHILWIERAIDTRLREKFFPEARQSLALHYAVLAQGKILRQQSLVVAAEGGAREEVAAARFQVAPPERLMVFYFVSGSDAQGRAVAENRILELSADGEVGAAVPVPLKTPMTAYFTASIRGGSPASHVLELLGLRAGQSDAIHYARVRLW